jgi:hypothetical protein
MLVAAMNPCPCGFLGDPVKECTCSPTAIGRYQKRISGPLLDRIDIHVEVPRVPYEKLSDYRPGEPSANIRERVEAARERQRQRFNEDGILCNSEMGPAQVRKYCQVDDTAQALLKAATGLIVRQGVLGAIDAGAERDLIACTAAALAPAGAGVLATAPVLVPPTLVAVLPQVNSAIALAVAFDMVAKPASIGVALGVVAGGVVLAAASVLRRPARTPTAAFTASTAG